MQIPKNAKRVFKGIIFDTYQWEQKMFNGTNETFEMLKRPDTVEIIATLDDKILICEQEQPNTSLFYSLFGGRVDKGEKPLNTAKRELLEEAGHSSKDWELINSHEPYSKMEWTVYVYIARNCKKTANQNLDAGEKIKILPVSFEKFLKIIDSEKFRDKDFYSYISKIKQSENKLNEFKKKLFKN
jgi:ADP-ribose pyrophosphatase